MNGFDVFTPDMPDEGLLQEIIITASIQTMAAIISTFYKETGEFPDNDWVSSYAIEYASTLAAKLVSNGIIN